MSNFYLLIHVLYLKLAISAQNFKPSRNNLLMRSRMKALRMMSEPPSCTGTVRWNLTLAVEFWCLARKQSNNKQNGNENAGFKKA